MKDAVATMGTILPDDVGGRDAVHVAVISVTAGESLYPGEHAKTRGKEGEELVAVKSRADGIGIVDPFLTDTVRKGQRFWLYLYPRTITSLRHNWTHPAFEDVKATYQTPAQQAEQKAKSVMWLHEFAQNSDCPEFETLMKIALNNQRSDGLYGSHNDGTYLHIDGQDAHGNIPDEFWDHLEVATGQKMTKRAKYFSCSC